MLGNNISLILFLCLVFKKYYKKLIPSEAFTWCIYLRFCFPVVYSKTHCKCISIRANQGYGKVCRLNHPAPTFLHPPIDLLMHILSLPAKHSQLLYSRWRIDEVTAWLASKTMLISLWRVQCCNKLQRLSSASHFPLSLTRASFSPQGYWNQHNTAVN